MTSIYGYDGANRLASLYHTKSTNDLAKYDFSWDNTDRLTSIDSLQDGVTNYTYDVTNQLTAADFATQTDETHAWTANGNPTGGGYTVTANNRVSTDGTYNYTYDNEGNRTRKTKISDGSYIDYVWDHRNRLISVISKTSGGTITQQVDYVYDFLNQLITRTIDTDGAGAVSPTSQWFAYSDGQIVLSFDSSSATTPDHRYLWGPQVDQLFADENSTNDLLYPLGDQVGTLRDIAQYDDGTDTTSVVNHVIFSSFNAQLSSSNSAYDILFGQTGRLHDSATGLDNHLHRWLDTWLKRWLGEDPSGFDAGDPNLNRFILNLPTVLTDPSGLEPPQLGYVSGAINDFANANQNNPLNITGMFVGPAALFDTLPFAIAQAAQDSRAVIVLEIETTNDPVQKVMGGVAYAYSIPGEGFAQFGNGEAGGQLLGLPLRLIAKAPKSAPTPIKNLGDDISRWLGKDAKTITNEAGDTIIQSADGLREIRFDFKHTYPHKNPHTHLIEYKLVKNKKVEIINRRIYPSGVTPE